MEKDTVVVATYDLLPTARNALQSLLSAGFERTDMGLAVKAGPGDGALLTVTLSEDRAEEAMETMKSHGATLCTVREAQWEMGRDSEHQEFSEYTAVGLE